MATERPTINLSSPLDGLAGVPTWDMVGLDRSYDRPSAMLEPAPDFAPSSFERLEAARNRRDRAEARIGEAYRLFMITASTIPTSGVGLQSWLDQHTERLAALVAEIRARVVADDDAKRAMASMKGGSR